MKIKNILFIFCILFLFINVVVYVKEVKIGMVIDDFCFECW